MDESWVIVETSASEAGDGQTNTQEDKVEREEKDDWAGQKCCKYV